MTMEIEQVAELARTVAALPQAERDYFDGVVADERAKAAEAERIAKLRGMSDEDAVQFAIKEASDVFAPGELPERLLSALRQAGFVRKAPLAAPAFQDGVTYARGDRVQVRGGVYECLSDGVQAFYHVSGRDPKGIQIRTPYWRAVGRSS